MIDLQALFQSHILRSVDKPKPDDAINQSIQLGWLTKIARINFQRLPL